MSRNMIIMGIDGTPTCSEAPPPDLPENSIRDSEQGDSTTHTRDVCLWTVSRRTKISTTGREGEHTCAAALQGASNPRRCESTDSRMKANIRRSSIIVQERGEHASPSIHWCYLWEQSKLPGQQSVKCQSGRQSNISMLDHMQQTV